MSHVFLRCTFGILLLFVALEPEATSTCNKEEIKNFFRNMIVNDIIHLNHSIEQYAPACNRSNIPVFCNQHEAIEIIYNMSCQLERISKICNITKDLNDNMNNTAELIFKVLKNCTIDQREPKRHCQGTGGRKRLCPICRIKEAVIKSMLCWFQFVRYWPP